MTGRARIGIAAALALLLTSAGLLRLLAGGTWIFPIVLAVIVAAAAGELFRRLIRPRPLVVAAQAAVVFWYDMLLLAHDRAFGGVLPTWAVFGKLADLYSDGAHDIRNTFVGGPATPGIAAILVLSLSALAVLVDALAATYAAAPLAGLPLLALYLVPATRSGGGYDWLAFALAAAGYTALLSAEGRDRLGRWGRPLVHAARRGPDGGAKPAAASRAKVDTGPIAATGHQITTLALVLAVLAPVLLPTVAGGLFGIGPNSGDGPGSGHKGKTGTFSQKLDLHANLRGDNDDVVLTYKAPKPTYLRFQTADKFDAVTPGQTFVPEPASAMISVPKDNVIAAAVPGYTASPQPKTFQITVDIKSGVSTEDHPGGNNALPLPYPVKQLDKQPDGFKINADSLALLGPGQINPGKQYSAVVYDTSSDTLPAQVLHAAKLATPDDISQFGLNKDLDTTGVPQQVIDLAARLTQGVTNPVDAATKIQNYFQNKANGFTYSLDVPDMNGAEAMLYLLSKQRGYCQFYAETMVAMARSLHIPARVALGFTPGSASAKGDGTYEVRMHDYHAWPELYFDGVGWLRFEPTVGIDDTSRSPGHGRVPQYNTIVPDNGATAPSATQSSSAAAPAGASSNSNCPDVVRRAGECGNENDSTAAAPKPKFSWLGWFGAVPRFLQYWLFGGSGYAIALRFILLVLLLLACVPMVLRIMRRRARGKLASGRRNKRGPTAASGSATEPEDGDDLDWRSADGPARRPESDPERLRVLAAWAEVRDSATDLGYTWPASETPRQSAQRIVKQAHLTRSAQDAMNRVTGLAERANYARTLRRPNPNGAAPMPNLMDDVKAIRAGLAEPVSRRTRLRATVLPPSALAALRERREDLTGRVYERLQSTGTRLRARTPGGGAGVRPEGRDGERGRRK